MFLRFPWCFRKDQGKEGQGLGTFPPGSAQTEGTRNAHRLGTAILISVFREQMSGTDMTGRPGYRTMEMIGGSSAPYLARTPCVPLFCTSFNRVGNKERFRLPGAGGGSFPLYGGTFARSYSVSKMGDRSRFVFCDPMCYRNRLGLN